MPSFGGNPRNTAPPPSRPSSSGGGFFSHIGSVIGHVGTAVQHATYTPPPVRQANAGTDVQSGGGYGGARVAAYKASPAYRQQVAGAYNAQPAATRTLALLRALQTIAPGTGKTQIPSAFLGSSPKQLLAQALLSQGNSKNAWDLSPAGKAVKNVDTLSTFMKLLAGGTQPASLSPTAGGFVPAGGKYIINRADQGRDGLTNPGGPIIAPGSGHVISVSSDPGGFGPAYPIVHFDTGPYAGRDIYLGHTLAAPGIQSGATFKAGQVLSHTGTSGVGNATQPGWFEIGFANGGSPGPNGQPTPFTGTSTQGNGNPQLNSTQRLTGKQAAKLASQPQVVKALAGRPVGKSIPVSAVTPAPAHGGSGTTGGRTFLITASMYGGPGDPTSGATGYRGDNLYQHPDTFAELSNNPSAGTHADFSALGNLPYGTKVTVTNPANGKSVVLTKRDVGAGGAGIGNTKRGIDLWYSAAQKIGLNGLGQVKVTIGGNQGPSSTLPTTGASSGSSAPAPSSGSSGSSAAPAASGGSSQAPADPNAAANAAVLASLAGNTTQVSAQDAQRQSLLQNLLSSSGKSPWDFGPRVPGLGGSSNPFALLLAQSSLQSLAGGLPLKSPFKTSKKSKG